MRKLSRARHDRRFLGVCGGIAHTYGYDPTLVRLATAILSIAIPGPSLVVTLLGYVILGIALPVDETM
ncbi:MAG: PspC domain-containing protein [Chloroflexota bacterium]|nr:PspC domain-containing protein [Chloroflexota bacterium]